MVVMQPKYSSAPRSKCDHLIKVQMHKVFLNNHWIWLYLGIIKAKLEAEGQSRSQGGDFLQIPTQSLSCGEGQELSTRPLQRDRLL